MSSLEDRKRAAVRHLRKQRAPRKPAPAAAASPAATPLAEFRAFPRKTRLHAELWLQRGALHEAVHHIIRERLVGWCKRVEEAGLREALLAEISPERAT